MCNIAADSVESNVMTGHDEQIPRSNRGDTRDSMSGGSHGQLTGTQSRDICVDWDRGDTDNL